MVTSLDMSDMKEDLDILGMKLHRECGDVKAPLSHMEHMLLHLLSVYVP